MHPDLAAEDFKNYFIKVFEAGITPIAIGGDHSSAWPDP